jgi:hypothetical protein
MPAIELTLTDSAGPARGARVLTPADLGVPSGTDLAAGPTGLATLP